MNYAHDFHAGNFADVFKHIFLTRILHYLARKPAPLRYIETHAGSGLYDLAGPQAERTAEWRTGVLRLAASPLEPEAQALVEPYLDIVKPLIGADSPLYPGSPLIASALLRPQDKMLACELHPDAFQRLRANLRRDRRAKAMEIDGYTGLMAFVPPVERRGLVLIDPPFEDAAEFDRLARALPAAARKWTSGVFMLWHPVKDRAAVGAFARALAEGFAASGVKSVLRIELQIDDVRPQGALTRCGLIIANPPFTLEAEARRILPGLSQRLARSLEAPRADYLVEWLGRN
ncbi:Ribosomal RNA large subunit methyltransferase J [Methylocella tundrae]|uniref:Ribosomal RNA large subunit methyltransferase J n=1 Tax=Methylocella tundrae TaxID=227605 RepID=A0A8B6MB73_METTU|nr:23S rRNA (adenine(2030)-N(6))-methyltransferase RlmJ [Methylocella tundrae]VTZ24542.1 Ribosomal RNA large subunit methyltransferase J [Methylocella tundrae]VTZ52142.1 Ribosomal RNA large subunit methyltransferase J [Methylocella tundrae]